MPRSSLSAASYRRTSVLVALLLCAPGLPSQQTPTFSSDVNVVNVLATVRDKHGQIVNNLSKDDFKLAQDGQPQTIGYFARDVDLPLKLGLLVDTSASQRRLIDQERTASYSFLNNLMRPDKDKAFVIHFDHEVELLQDLTASRNKLEAALDKLGAPQFEQSTGGSSGGSGGGYPGGGGGGYPGAGTHRHSGGGTTLYDSVFLASDELMRKQGGRKALIVLTDGVDTGSKVSLYRAIETAQRAHTLVYSILYSDPEAYAHQGYPGHHGGWGGGGMGRYPGGGYPQPTERPDGKKVLQRLSKETGGRFFEVSKKEPIGQIYSAIEQELRSQYNLGFTPDKAHATPGYHRIALTTTNKDLTVQAQEGYYAAQ